MVGGGDICMIWMCWMCCVWMLGAGCDPSMDDWKVISEVIKRKDHICLFDNAYQVPYIYFW